jgi:hypothetical protein
MRANLRTLPGVLDANGAEYFAGFVFWRRRASSPPARWFSNKDALVDYAQGTLNLAQLYNAIGSPAAGNWQDFE